jgi:hypothetical protein
MSLVDLQSCILVRSICVVWIHILSHYIVFVFFTFSIFVDLCRTKPQKNVVSFN